MLVTTEAPWDVDSVSDEDLDGAALLSLPDPTTSGVGGNGARTLHESGAEAS